MQYIDIELYQPSQLYSSCGEMKRKCLRLVVIGSVVSVMFYLAALKYQNSPSSSPRTGPSPSPTYSLSTSYRLQASKNLRSSYLMKYHFVIRDDFTLPVPKATLAIYDLIRQQWMEDLRAYLHKIHPHNSNNSLISIVSCDSKFKGFLLNWLISATIDTHPPLRNILVLSLDQPLHRTLVKHGFDSVYIDSKELLMPFLLSELQASNRPGFHVVMILRLTVMRFLTHWGYDAANYDTDAIILKNPEHHYYADFNSTDIIGSRGKFPTKVFDVFGLTLCAGVFVIKSSPETGESFVAQSWLYHSNGSHYWMGEYFVLP